MGKRILITGGAGLLGWNLAIGLRDEHECVATVYRSPVASCTCRANGQPPIRTVTCDIQSKEDVVRLCQSLSPDVIIHTAALSSPDLCDKEKNLAYQTNVIGTKNLVEAVKPLRRTRFIFISTDLVFDGEKGSYTEDDAPNPRNYYAQTKLEGEQLVQSLGNRAVIARVALMYGNPSPAHHSFLGWLEEGLRSDKVRLFTDEYRTPILVDDIIEALRRLLGSKDRGSREVDYCGVLHLGGGKRLSRYEFGTIYAQVFGYSHATIQAVSLSEVPILAYRPRDVSLDNTQAQQLLDMRFRTPEQGITFLKQQGKCQ